MLIVIIVVVILLLLSFLYYNLFTVYLVQKESEKMFVCVQGFVAAFVAMEHYGLGLCAPENKNEMIPEKIKPQI